ncbi:hypothetical protein GBAR_LOCUS754 [Geodia barretti]|uniref:Uncharacterized protein n=1 Tax=Geodia barretti TaxID=519541 RepID=A0AA35QUG4_GEOBA|nr:hypothetical protein GBAR_LOCUS754 [Geodia barretti]
MWSFVITERSRPKDKRDRHRSRSRSPHRDSKRKKERKRHSSSRSRSRERTKSKKPSKDKEKTGKSSDAKGENPAEALKARVKALLAKSSEETAKAAAVEMSGAPVPTPGQTALIESNSFTSDKFVSKRSSKKWDVPPSGVSQKKAGKTFDVTTVDPSEFVPKVVPMCEVENALGREEGMGVMEEGGRDVVSIRQETTQSTPETEPVDRNQKWLQKLKKMRQKLADPPIN